MEVQRLTCPVIRTSLELARQHGRAVGIVTTGGLTDASIVVQAARHKTTKILSLDHKHFGAVRPLTGDASFTLLPRDDQA